MLICFAQETQRGTEAVETAVRERWPAETDVHVAYVVDLRKVPSVFRKVAEGMLASEYTKAVAELQPGQEAWGYTLILPDWRGEVGTAFGLQDPSKQASVAVIAADGRLAGTASVVDIGVVLSLVQNALA